MRSGCHAKWCPLADSFGDGRAITKWSCNHPSNRLRCKETLKTWADYRGCSSKVVLQDPLVFRNPGCSQRFLDWSTHHKMLRFRKTWIESKGFFLDWIHLVGPVAVTKAPGFPSTDQLNQPSPQGKCLMTCLSKLNTVGWFSRTLNFWLK